MSTTLEVRTRLSASIATRVQIHQGRMAALNIARSSLAARGGGEMQTPLVLLAVGDSWFDYPLYGNGPLPMDTDVIAQLRSLGSVNPMILNISHFGDATTNELALPKQQRLVAALTDPANWLSSGKPDAILFSAGGNDIAGDRFCIYLDSNVPGSNGLNQIRLDGVFASIEASYLDLFDFRDQYAPGVPIFAHDYDFPVPNGVHPICTSTAWLRPSLVFRGWTNVAEGASIVRSGLSGFRTLLERLAADPANTFHLIDTQGTLAPGDWANELHATPEGFKAIAERFVTALGAYFPGRI